jgi:hypothetical protein
MATSLNSTQRLAVVASLLASMTVIQELALADVNGAVRLIGDDNGTGTSSGF